VDACLALLPSALYLFLPATGVEIIATRRVVDLSTVTAVRVTYGSSLGAVAVRVDYSDDGGTTWTPLTTQPGAAVDGTVYASPWEPTPAGATSNDVLVRAVGTAAGLTPQLTFIDLQYR
jgi:hypothetical protein